MLYLLNSNKKQLDYLLASFVINALYQKLYVFYKDLVNLIQVIYNDFIDDYADITKWIKQ